jgi:hypothetical protein
MGRSRDALRAGWKPKKTPTSKRHGGDAPEQPGQYAGAFIGALGPLGEIVVAEIIRLVFLKLVALA